MKEDKDIERIVKHINERLDASGKTVMDIVNETGLNYLTVVAFREGKEKNFYAVTINKMARAAGIYTEEMEALFDDCAH